MLQQLQCLKNSCEATCDTFYSYGDGFGGLTNDFWCSIQPIVKHLGNSLCLHYVEVFFFFPLTTQACIAHPIIGANYGYYESELSDTKLLLILIFILGDSGSLQSSLRMLLAIVKF